MPKDRPLMLNNKELWVVECVYSKTGPEKIFHANGSTLIIICNSAFFGANA